MEKPVIGKSAVKCKKVLLNLIKVPVNGEKLAENWKKCQ